MKVKIITRGKAIASQRFRNQISSQLKSQVTYLFDRRARGYDWLVVVDDLSRSLTDPPEILDCPKENTILVTTEPASITRYGRNFTSQFGMVLTSQEECFLPHSNRLYSHTGNLWFYGKNIDEVIAEPFPSKKNDLSTICSFKSQQHTRHALRNSFTKILQQNIPEIDVFGREFRPLKDKFLALIPYRFHLAIENHISRHHWTEKLADPFLAYAVPIYSGCPNAAEYFPARSFVSIDLTDFKSAIALIRQIISTPGEYEKRLDSVIEARRRVIQNYNLPTMLTEYILSHATGQKSSDRRNMMIFNRKQMRASSVTDLGEFLSWRFSNMIKDCLKNRSTKKGITSPCAGIGSKPPCYS